MKKLLALLLVLVMALGLCACGVDVNPEPPADENQDSLPGIVNPISSSSAEEVQELYGMILPDRAENISYSLISSGDDQPVMAQVSFTLDGAECTYRATASDGLKDISGMYYAWEKAGSCDVADCVANVRYNPGEMGVCFWYDSEADTAYSISVVQGAEEEYLISLAEYLNNCRNGIEQLPGAQPDENPDEETTPDDETVVDPDIIATVGYTIAETASAQLGKSFEWGQAGPDSFDNSGLVQFCLNENGISVGRTTGEIFAKGTEIPVEELLPGDVLFFTYSDDGSPTYCGVYVGDGLFVAANNEDSPISVIDFTDSHYQQRFVAAHRYA